MDKNDGVPMVEKVDMPSPWPSAPHVSVTQ
jgi:hypothetical protein